MLMWIVLSPVTSESFDFPVSSLCQPDNDVTAAAPDIFILPPVYLSGFTNTIQSLIKASEGEKQYYTYLINSFDLPKVKAE